MASQDTGRQLPKFGEWNVSNPTVAEGYTMIFKRARDEKKAGYANMVTPRKSKPMYTHDSYPRYPRKSKWFCCGFRMINKIV
ncbi:hypothetical protein QN277_006638 [Acacia crassicarpa]|uniref:RIN4 pathogenic type III effector avirulence factor Avr cleavage site domain-containing protein n=1 Tax=Acacia crassicarpa TaxID=499986 RepID=A0AAE1MC07_9FABA|nr:hypothetical protein QN277_006638 [Acacia crassicarpa]